METTSEDRAYLAGMIDADGSVVLRQQRSGTLDMEVLVYNVNEPLMRWIHDTFGGTVRSEKRAKYDSWRIRWIWAAAGTTGYRVLQDVKRYMIVKQPQAELAIEAFDTKGNFRGHKGGVPDEVRAHRLDLVERMHALNAVGGNGRKDVFAK